MDFALQFKGMAHRCGLLKESLLLQFEARNSVKDESQLVQKEGTSGVTLRKLGTKEIPY